jgi:hypothetical protein
MADARPAKASMMTRITAGKASWGALSVFFMHAVILIGIPAPI